MNGRVLATVFAAAMAATLGLLVVANNRSGQAGQPVPWQPVSGTAAPVATASGPEDRVDGYLAVAPKVLHSGQGEAVSVSLFGSGDRPANGSVRLALLKDGKEVAASTAYLQGRSDVNLPVPTLAEGDYRLRLSGNCFQTEAPVRVEEGTLVFAETDKPIYKPGQIIHIRTLTVDTSLKPVPGPVNVEVMDAKGLKIYKRDVVTDEYGMASVDLPLSPEPNLGTWKITAKMAKRSAQLDVRVERYVLPKYEVKVNLAKDWVLASDAITGNVSAEYSYGKPVQGEAQIRALRYAGTWQEFANVTRNLEGKVDFSLPAVRYVAGVPGAGGMGNVQLEITVREKSTGYEEKTTQLIRIAATPVVLKMIPESVGFVPSMALSLLVTAETPDRKPLDAAVSVNVAYTKKDFTVTQQTSQVSVKQGRAILQITPPPMRFPLPCPQPAAVPAPRWRCSPAIRPPAASFGWSR